MVLELMQTILAEDRTSDIAVYTQVGSSTGSDCINKFVKIT